MSAVATASDPPPPSRSGRLLSLVRRLIDYGKDLADKLRQRTAAAADTTDLVCNFGIRDVTIILARITQGLQRARFLKDKISRAAARLDAEPQPKSAASPRAPRTALRCDAQPPSPPQTQVQAADTDPRLAQLPTPDQIAAKVRRQPIGAVLADICRDLGIYPAHPLWRELHRAINQYGGNWGRMALDQLNQVFPVTHIVARLKVERAAARTPASTGPPSVVPAHSA